MPLFYQMLETGIEIQHVLKNCFFRFCENYDNKSSVNNNATEKKSSVANNATVDNKFNSEKHR